MRNKKSSEPLNTIPGLDPDLEARVDSIMGENNVESHVAAPTLIVDADKAEEVTVPVDHTIVVSSAPDVPAELLKAIEKDGPVEATVVTPTPSNAEEPETTIESEPEDQILDEAVNDITIAEADEVLAAEDAKIAEVTEIPKTKSRNKIASFFAKWWNNPVARWATILIIIGGIVAAAAVPNSRYYILNSVGTRSSASVIVIDGSTGQPLQNVSVSIGGKKTKTNESGTAKITNLHLGDQKYIVSRVAFAPVEKTITIGWGSNPLGEQPLKATGVQYVLNTTDFLSEKPVSAKATSGEATAQSDPKGKLVLTLEDPESNMVEIALTADGYRTETLTISAETTEPQAVRMAPATPLVYVTKQQGTYDLYKVDVDGKNKQLLVKGSGSERPAISLMNSPDGTFAALVSSRESKYDSEKYLLDTLTLVNLKTAETTKIDQAQSIKLITWRGDRLVYLAAYAAPSAATNDRQRLVSYNVSESARTALANGNYFVGIYAIDDVIYYGISSPGTKDGGVYAKVKIDGTGKNVLLAQSIWSISRTKLDEIHVYADDSWYRHDVSGGSLSKLSGQQNNFQPIDYYMASDGKYGAFIDKRDGQNVLLLITPGKADKSLVTARNIYGPVTWLNATTVSYYVDNGNETAEYVLSTQGGNPVKISTATLVSGAGAGYY